MMLLKEGIKKTLKLIHPDLQCRLLDQMRFNRLGRRPPELMWEALWPGPSVRLDAGGIQIGEELFIFGGFCGGGNVLSFVDVLNLRTHRWTRRPTPEDFPQSHLGMIGDDKRYIYSVSGQLGSNCRPPTTNCFVFDALERRWTKMPPLPKARYAATVQLWNGRLHAIAGSAEDRNTPARDHWSIAVDGRKALEDRWREEPPVPRGGPHRASAVIDDKLYVFGGQEGDYIAIPGDPNFKCTGDLTCEEMYPDVYRLQRGSRQWQRMADIPVQSSHTEFSIIRSGPKVILLGGQCAKDPATKIIQLTDAIQMYDAQNDSWRITGCLPYRVKSAVAAYHNGWLYMTTGQRDQSPTDPTPGTFERGLWRARFSF